MAALDDITSILEDEESLRYEEEIRYHLHSFRWHFYFYPFTQPLLACCLCSRNPYLLDVWTKYLAFKKRAKPRVRYLIYERALK